VLVEPPEEALLPRVALAVEAEVLPEVLQALELGACADERLPFSEWAAYRRETEECSFLFLF